VRWLVPKTAGFVNDHRVKLATVHFDGAAVTELACDEMA
jgi:hypothetical protein